MKKKYKVNYNLGDGIIIVIITDDTGRKEDTLKANISDKKAIRAIGNLLKEKYDINLTPLEEQKKEDRFFDY